MNDWGYACWAKIMAKADRRGGNAPGRFRGRTTPRSTH